MTNEYNQEYSEQIKYSDWDWNWRLDKDDEDQLEVDVMEAQALLEFLQRRKQIGSKGRPSQKS